MNISIFPKLNKHNDKINFIVKIKRKTDGKNVKKRK